MDKPVFHGREISPMPAFDFNEFADKRIIELVILCERADHIVDFFFGSIATRETAEPPDPLPLCVKGEVHIPIGQFKK